MIEKSIVAAKKTNTKVRERIFESSHAPPCCGNAVLAAVKLSQYTPEQSCDIVNFTHSELILFSSNPK
jgi:hypothetical protein